MIKIQVHNAEQTDQKVIATIVGFLVDHLDDYGDPEPQIENAVLHSLGMKGSAEGLLLTAHDASTLVGAAVVNKTGMSGYIPENQLVYLSIHRSYRRKGLGEHLMQAVMKNCDGDIALHVDRNNPARHLYSKLGFTSPYLEMRWKRDDHFY